MPSSHASAPAHEAGVSRPKRVRFTPNLIDIHLGRRLRSRRGILGLTQQQLAGLCGVRFQQIQKYECATNRMSAARLWQLAQILEVPVTYFYDGLSPDLLTKGPEVRPAAT